MSLKIIESTTYNIEFGQLEESSFIDLLKTYEGAKKIIFVDENTHDNCLEFLITQFDELTEAEVILLPSGEENKVMEVCFQVWQAMTDYKIGRSDLVINLGGGVVSDMGGFIASIFKRGVNFVNIPTSLLAMVDASVGGKTGIDLGPFKNQLGVFANPLAVYIDHRFLSTLPQEEWINGYAEMLKHGVIASRKHWDAIAAKSPVEIKLEDIYESVRIKNQIILNDPKENGERKLLNFGHTVGHALEGYFLETNQKIPHGLAVAWGMIVESQLSSNQGLMKEPDFFELLKVINSNFPPLPDLKEIQEHLVELMRQDKKNKDGRINFVLPIEIGEAKIDQFISPVGIKF